MTDFDWGAWRRFYARLARQQGPRVGREAAVRAALGIVSAWTWARDPVAPPPIEPVVIVIGHQRSGTTWLHRMLAAQPGASAMPLKTLLLPADGCQRATPRWLQRVQDRVLGPLDDLHRIRLSEPEEDEFLLWALFRSPLCMLDRPWPPPGPPAIDGDEAAMRFYAQAVARHVRRTRRRYVGKNPHFTWRTADVRRVLPSVKFVQLWRHPEAAIASRLSLVRAIWRRRGIADDLTPSDVAFVYANSIRTYLGGLGAADIDLTYASLVRDPARAVAAVHSALDLGPPDTSRLGPHLRAGASRHRYTLAEFGLDPDQLRADLAPVYDRWGF